MNVNGCWMTLDGYRFGAGTSVKIMDFIVGQRAVRDQDTDRHPQHGRHMGQDSDDGPELTLDLSVRAGGAEANLNEAGRLRAAWQGKQDPGELSVLTYALPGRVRRAYGRPRRFSAPNLHSALHENRYPVLATFQMEDPWFYDDTERSTTLRIIPTSEVGGFIFPLLIPWSTTRSGAPMSRIADVRGDAPAPYSVTFRGPVRDPWVDVAGQRLRLTGALAWDQTVTLDGRTRTVTRQDGASVVGMLHPTARLSGMALDPGSHDVTFGGVDPTGTATATLAWRDAYYFI